MKYVGEAEEKLRNIFETAHEQSLVRSLPSFIFFDEIDSVLGKRDSSENNFEIRFVD
jgi:SpoVK/Ycf46/Vps4 family AAA+-type ATPase